MLKGQMLEPVQPMIHGMINFIDGLNVAQRVSLYWILMKDFDMFLILLIQQVEISDYYYGKLKLNIMKKSFKVLLIDMTLSMMIAI